MYLACTGKYRSTGGAYIKKTMPALITRFLWRYVFYPKTVFVDQVLKRSEPCPLFFAVGRVGQLHPAFIGEETSKRVEQLVIRFSYIF